MKKTFLVLFAFTSIVLAACNALQGPVDIQVVRESKPVASAKELLVDLKYDVGELEITKTSEDLISYELQYDRNHYDTRFTFDEGERSSARLELNGRGGFGSTGTHDNDLNLRLTDKVPIDLNLTAGVSESRLEMTGIQLRRLHLRGGVGKTEVTFDKPSGQTMSSLDVESGVGELLMHGLGNARVEQLDLKGGVGHTELDFTGDLGSASTEARIKVGVGSVRLTIPREADVDIEAEGSFLSNISASSFEHNGRNYTHRGGGASKIRIRVESGVGSVEIELL
jgi:predicted small secreted protein